MFGLVEGLIAAAIGLIILVANAYSNYPVEAAVAVGIAVILGNVAIFVAPKVMPGSWRVYWHVTRIGATPKYRVQGDAARYDEAA